MNLSKPILALHRDAFSQFPFRWIYYCHNSKSNIKETGKTNICTLAEILTYKDLINVGIYKYVNKGNDDKMGDTDTA